VNSITIARLIARGVRGLTYGRLRFELDRPARPRHDLDATVFTLVGTRQVLDLLVSARSFLENVGRPREFVVISDGTLSRYDVPRIQRLDPSLVVRPLTSVLPDDLPVEVLRYGLSEPMGQKLALEVGLPVDGPTLYTDSDILFFPAASELRSLLAAGGSPRFLRDWKGSFDDRLLSAEERELPPVNAGFFFTFEPLSWEEPLRRLRELGGEPEFHSEQTLMHAAMHASGGTPLPPERFLLRNDDASSFREPLVAPDVVLRHYTAPVRHKLWLRAGRSVLRP
jgi:hypothetical protein